MTRKKRSIERDHRIEFRLTEDEYDLLEKLAFQADTTLSAVIRAAIKNYATDNYRRR